MGALGDDSARIAIHHANDQSAEGHADDMDSTYMG